MEKNLKKNIYIYVYIAYIYLCIYRHIDIHNIYETNVIL